MKKMIIILAALIAALIPAAAAQGQSGTFYIDEWSTDPETLTRGDTFTLTMTLTNTSNRDLDNVQAQVLDNEQFIGLGPNAIVEEVERDGQVTVEIEVGVSNTIATGYYSLPVQVSYQIFNSPVTEDHTIGVEVQGLAPSSQERDVDSPRLIVDGYLSNPDPAVTGAPTELTLTIANVGAQDAEQVFVRLTELDPLAPAESSNVRAVGSIAPNSTEDVTYTLIAGGEATAGLVSVGVELTYRDALGVEQTETFTISLRLATPANLVFNLFESLPPEIMVGQPVELPLEVINIGENTVNVSTATVSAEGADVTSGGSQYIGPLEGGTAGSIIADVVPTEDGEVTVEVTITYLDDFSQEQTETYQVTLEVEDTPQGDEEQSGEPEDLTITQRITRAIAGFFGLGTREPQIADFGGGN